MRPNKALHPTAAPDEAAAGERRRRPLGEQQATVTRRTHVVRLEKWDQIHRYVRPRWVYRGQKSARWRLETSLERCCRRQNVKPENRRNFEDALIREFMRAYHQYSPRIPESSAIVEWLSLMQHHGAPTRLLDATYSIYVAAYFALEHASSDCAVWAIDAKWAVNAAVDVLRRKKGPRVDRLLQPIREGDEELIRDVFFSPKYVRVAYPVNPFRLSERLRIQRGAFLMPGDVSKSFAVNLSGQPGHESPTNVIKIVIPKALRLNALDRLFSMDISRSSLFPGIDGFAQSLAVYHTAYNREPWALRLSKRRE